MSRNHRTITLNDVAARAGVSKTTAASVLRNHAGFRVTEETRQRVIEASIGLGYQRNALAASLSSGWTQAVGVLLPIEYGQNWDGIRSTYAQDVFTALFRAANRVGLRITPISPPTPERPLRLSDVSDRRVDGLIFASLNDPAFVDSVQNAGIPCVELGSGTGRYLVHPDNEGGMEQAMAHLADLGHRRVAHRYPGPGFASDHRLAGFLAAAERHHMQEAVVVESSASMERLLRGASDQRPTAVIAFNDYYGLQTYDIAHAIGLRIPEDLSIIGFDNSVLSTAARPRMTTIDNPLVAQADRAIEALQALWRGEEPTSRQSVPTSLITRSSTGPPSPPPA